jgi:protein tyrosine phosphatase (PTP) superfamily phosphohydrolase (DUF442 family)/cytochrome c556
MSLVRCGTGLLLVAAAAAWFVGCGSAGPAVERPTQVVFDAKGEPAGLEHYRKWSDKVSQSGQPTGEVAFANLAAMGYRTVISVDGARPDAETAAKYGLRYVHVPIEYSGITRDQALRIVKAVETSDGPAIVHCHHGLHRGPAGAMVARLALEGISNEEANRELKESGCSPKYEGLYRDVLGFRPPTAEELAAIPADLPAYVSAGDTVDHMAKISRIYEGLQASQKAAWGPPPESPDVNPPHQARILWEHFAELQRTDESKSFGEQYLKWLAVSQQDGVKLEEAIRGGDAAAADAAMASLKKTCDSCHKKHRDN